MIYLDNAATTAVLPNVATIARKYMCEVYGNPSSRHQWGVDAEHAVTTSKKMIAKHLHGAPEQIVFTSGGTESNNAILLDRRLLAAEKPIHIIASPLEHQSVLACLDLLAARGHHVTMLDHTRGQITAASVTAALRDNTKLVSLMYVNNEIGVINPIGDIARALKLAGFNGHFHCDGVQAVGKLAVDFAALEVDSLSVSGHKFHAPKGVGMLLLKDAKRFESLIVGGGQQANRRSGTENVAGIAAMATALRLVSQQQRAASAVLERFERLVVALSESLGAARCKLLRDADAHSPYIYSLAFYGLKSEVLLHALESDGLIVSSGSACQSNHRRAHSHVIEALDLADDWSDGVIRLSPSPFTPEADLWQAITVLKRTVNRLYQQLGIH